MYIEEIGNRKYFAEVIADDLLKKSFLKIWWNNNGKDISLELYPGNGLEYIVDNYTESESINGVYKQMLSSLSEVATGIKTGIGVWKGGRIRFSYWVNEEGIFFVDENEDEVEKLTIKDILSRLNGVKPFNWEFDTSGMSFIEKFAYVFSSLDKNPCPFMNKDKICFADGEHCNHYRKFVYYGHTCPRYETDFELEKKLFGKV